MSAALRPLRASLLALALAAPGLAHAVGSPAEMLADPAREARAERIGERLRCLVCQNESIEDSGAPLARDLRRIVRRQVMEGRSDRQIMGWMVARYGEFVRLSPRLDATTLLLWAMPFAALAAALGLAAAALRGAGRAAQPAPLAPSERARLEALLDEADAGRPGREGRA